jgi:hypothetical protein
MYQAYYTPNNSVNNYYPSTNIYDSNSNENSFNDVYNTDYSAQCSQLYSTPQHVHNTSYLPQYTQYAYANAYPNQYASNQQYDNTSDTNYANYYSYTSPVSSNTSVLTNTTSVSNNSLTMSIESRQRVSEAKRTRTTNSRSHHNQLPEEAVEILNDWFDSHLNHPYPSTDEKNRLADKCCITVKQVNSWFCNRRNRSQNTKPKRIKRQLEQEITNVYKELVCNPNKAEVIEKFRSSLIANSIDKF